MKKIENINIYLLKAQWIKVLDSLLRIDVQY